MVNIFYIACKMLKCRASMKLFDTILYKCTLLNKVIFWHKISKLKIYFNTEAQYFINSLKKGKHLKAQFYMLLWLSSWRRQQVWRECRPPPSASSSPVCRERSPPWQLIGRFLESKRENQPILWVVYFIFWSKFLYKKIRSNNLYSRYVTHFGLKWL